MVMLLEGINRIRDLIGTNFDKGQFGTGTTVELVSDSSIVTGVSDTLKNTSNSVVSQFIELTNSINSVEGNGSTLSEHVIVKSSNSKTVNRVTFTGLSKTNLFNFRNRTRFFLE